MTREARPQFFWALKLSSFQYDHKKVLPIPANHSPSQEERAAGSPEIIDTVVKCLWVGMSPTTAINHKSAELGKAANIKEDRTALRVVVHVTAPSSVKFYALMDTGGIKRPYKINNDLVFYFTEPSFKCPLAVGEASPPDDQKDQKVFMDCRHTVQIQNALLALRSEKILAVTGTPFANS